MQVAFTVTDSDLHEVGYAITNARPQNDTLFSNEEHTESNYSFNKI